jgi:hypothetical protein
MRFRTKGATVAATVLYKDRTTTAPGAASEGDGLWLPPAELRESSGWELKPEGACLDEVCVPLPPGREGEFVRDGGQFNLAALARLLGQPVVHDDAHGVWAFGESGDARRNTLASLEAPDFTLPDLEGRLHSLSDYRGKKVLLVSWASW